MKYSKEELLKMKVYQLETNDRFTQSIESLYSRDVISDMIHNAARHMAFEEALMFRYVWKWRTKQPYIVEQEI